MKISLNWLQDYIESDLSTEEIAELLTSIGLEVESIAHYESIRGGLEHFYIGEVRTCARHPNADKLSLTEVDLGGTLGIRKIVCGAPNVAAGQKVIVAIEGAKIYMPNKDPFEIKAAKIRGEESRGMICAEDEIGVGTSHEGILVLNEKAIVGTPAAEYFEIVRDIIFEIGLTPNRTDAMYHQGVARDLAAAMTARNIPHQYWQEGREKWDIPKSHVNTLFDVQLNTPLASKFYTAIVRNMTTKETPKWMSHRLRAIGEQSRGLVVDMTNYILHDLGQPMHAYDMDKLNDSGFTIQSQSKNADFIALNGQKYTTTEGDIVIVNTNEIAGLAGIIGSQSTAVDESTKSILLEAAYFDRKQIRKTSQRLSLKTEASSKFEKGINPNGIEQALDKARKILFSVDSEAIFSDIQSVSNQDFPNHEVALSDEKLRLYTQIPIEKSEIERILQSLGIEIISHTDGLWRLSVPRYKEDVTRAEDVIEEILRIYGYHQVPYPKYLKSSLSFSNGITRSDLEEKIANIFVGEGFAEIMTNSISQSRYYDTIPYVKLLNSMTSELDSMRATIAPGVMEVVEYNINRDQKDLRLFEIGNIYGQVEGKYTQTKKLILAVTGLSEQASWRNSKGLPNDYYQLKSMVEKLMSQLGIAIQYQEADSQELSYGLDIYLGKDRLGFLGLYKTDERYFDIKQEVYVAEFDYEMLYQHILQQQIRYEEISKYPQVRRDLALVVEEGVKFDQIEKVCKEAISANLKSVGLFDVFRGKALGDNKKSYAIRLTLEDKEKTMQDKDIESKMNRLVKRLTQDLGAEIRS